MKRLPPQIIQTVRVHRDGNGKETGREVIESREVTDEDFRRMEIDNLAWKYSYTNIWFGFDRRAYEEYNFLPLGEDSV